MKFTKKQLKILDEKKDNPSEVVFIRLMNECGAYK